MSTFLQAAYEVLSRERRPLSHEEIVELALALGLLKTQGQTPADSMRARLSTDILRKKERSRFMRTPDGLVALRAWGGAERVAPRFTPPLFDEDVVVFPATELWKHIDKIGFSERRIDSRALLAECSPLRRRIAEERYDVIQLVVLFLVRYRDRYLTHKRTKRLPESRLHGVYSITFGGHLNPSDLGNFSPLFDPFDPDSGGLFARELDEELRLPCRPKISYRGLIYDESRQVSRQHLGILYDAAVPTSEFQVGERGFLTDAKYERIDEILRRYNDFENWSQLIIDQEAS